MLSALCAVAVVLVGIQGALFLDPEAPLAPASWAVLSVCVWLLFVLSKGGWSELSTNDVRRFAFGVFAAVLFLHFLQVDSSFKGWSSVYYFCGDKLQYCTCNFRWNVHGWLKAVILWQFVLSATLGAQQLIIQAGLGGLLPGEEAVTRESFISICWRLIPYWLNNWEQQWGAEVSSMTFELPHFAVELLIILPCCQIICSRLKVLVTPQVNVLLGPGQGQGVGPGQGGGGGGAGGDGGVEEVPFVREDFAPNVLQGFWERRPEQRRFIPRVRSNLRVLVFVTGLTALAALNATVVPTYLEGQAAGAPETPALIFSGRHPDWLLAAPAGALKTTTAAGSASAAELALLEVAQARYRLYGGDGSSDGKSCPEREPYARSVAKHAVELQRMQDPEHRSLIPLVESALAIMRLSCEKYFVLLAIYLAFLLFRDAPRPARAVIRLVARVSGIFQKVILFAFPAVCWLYNAGVVFSLFVSVVFWGGPLLALYETARTTLREVSIKGLEPASREQVERMGGSCAICWGDMAAPRHRSRVRCRPPEAPKSAAGASASGSPATQRCAPQPALFDAAGAGAEQLAAGTATATAAGPTAGLTAADVGALPEGDRWLGHHAGVQWPDEGAGSGHKEAAAGARSGRVDLQEGVAAPCQLGDATGTTGRDGVSNSGSSNSVPHGALAGAHAQRQAHVCAPRRAEIGSAGGATAKVAVAASSSSAGYDEGRARSASASDPASVPSAPVSATSSQALEAGSDDDGRDDVSAGGTRPAEAEATAAGPGGAAASAGADTSAAGWALPCGHAYHHSCLMQWMDQCSSSGATPTCPMCQRGIQLQVHWRLPALMRRAATGGGGGGDAHGTARLLGAAAAAGGGGAPAAAAGAVAADLAAGEELLNAVRHFAGRDAGLQVVGLLEHQRELHELLHDAPAIEFGELLREVQPLIVQHAAQELQQVAREGPPAPPPAAAAVAVPGGGAGGLQWQWQDAEAAQGPGRPGLEPGLPATQAGMGWGPVVSSEGHEQEATEAPRTLGGFTGVEAGSARAPLGGSGSSAGVTASPDHCAWVGDDAAEASGLAAGPDGNRGRCADGNHYASAASCSTSSCALRRLQGASGGKVGNSDGNGSALTKHGTCFGAAGPQRGGSGTDGRRGWCPSTVAAAASFLPEVGAAAAGAGSGDRDGGCGGESPSCYPRYSCQDGLTALPSAAASGVAAAVSHSAAEGCEVKEEDISLQAGGCGGATHGERGAEEPGILAPEACAARASGTAPVAGGALAAGMAPDDGTTLYGNTGRQAVVGVMVAVSPATQLKGSGAVVQPAAEAGKGHRVHESSAAAGAPSQRTSGATSGSRSLRGSEDEGAGGDGGGTTIAAPPAATATAAAAAAATAAGSQEVALLVARPNKPRRRFLFWRRRQQ